MKNQQLKAGLIALVLTTLFYACAVGQTSVNTMNDVTGLIPAQEQSISPYAIIHGDVINADIKLDKVEIGLYVLEDDCTWTEVESFTDNTYQFVLDRESEYQIWFHDLNDVKIMYVKPGYQGNFVYRVDANFTTNDCVIMYPDDTGESLLMEVISFYDLEPYIYQDGTITN